MSSNVVPFVLRTPPVPHETYAYLASVPRDSEWAQPSVVDYITSRSEPVATTYQPPAISIAQTIALIAVAMLLVTAVALALHQMFVAGVTGGEYLLWGIVASVGVGIVLMVSFVLANPPPRRMR